MAFTLTSQTNVGYNANFDTLSITDKIRRGLASGGFQDDAAGKAFGNANGGPAFLLIGQTTAAETGAFTLNLVTATRSVPNPLGSPSLNDPVTLQGVTKALVTGTVFPVRFRVKQLTAGVGNVFWCASTVTGAATPGVANGAAASKIGSSQGATDNVILASGVGSLTVSVVAANAVTTVWTVEVYIEDSL